ncbi:MAG: hypothetical protein EOP84_09700 [Verrucomicrobiaceae bacterium]|nr:MAG: hypothetical protein EOP84_09700 [Verrucomicrobiaceae bacterium]
MLPLAPLLALDRSVYGTLESELEALIDGAGDVWAYSGNGGYVFKFEKDVSGGPEPELFVNFSLRPEVWHVFTGGDNKVPIGKIMFPSFDFKQSAKENGRTRILRAYSADSYASPPFEPFGNYILEEIITESGIASKIRKVGVDATVVEFNDLRREAGSETISWAKPSVQAITLRDLLLEPDANWSDFDPDETQVRNGYYRLPRDEAQISALESTFTPKVALEALNQKFGVSQRTRDGVPPASNGPRRSTPAPATASPAAESASQPRASTISATVETEATPRFPILPVTIAGVVISGIVLYLLRRNST